MLYEDQLLEALQHVQAGKTTPYMALTIVKMIVQANVAAHRFPPPPCPNDSAANGALVNTEQVSRPS